ncbi:MAG: response regulator transcription factor [Acidobacteriota bacterium]|nr:response regulator transcription factor [Acidobacteriota bacterium]
MPAASPKTRVLVVEDDERTARWLMLYLEREGLEVRVAATADEALASVTEAPPALVLLDVMLPGAGGFDVCRAIRAGSTVPIIFITARTGEDDRLTGFDLGADDYITKPFSPREVVARVRAVLRRSTDTAAGAPEARLGDVLLRSDALTVSRGGAQVKLTPVEARLLSALMAAPKRVLTRPQLVSRACGEDYEGTERTVDAHIKNLRRKLAQLPEGETPLRIVTTHGVGYHLELD